jgi:uroporphyrin-3 C-methyltransferase
MMAWSPDYWSTFVNTPASPEDATSQTSEISTAAGEVAGGVRQPRRFRPAALIAAAALALLGWQWLETRSRLSDVQEETARRLAESDTIAKESRTLARQAQESLQMLQAKTAALEAKLAETQGQQLALESMYQELSKGRDERLLAEVEHAVTIAAQQLQLAGNIEAALIALSAADSRLARSSQPQLLGLRKLIARDIERLKAQPTADVPGLALKLEGVIGAVDSMPLAFEQRPKTESLRPAGTPAQLGFWQALGSDFWNEIRQLIRIERLDAGHADPALLSPSQSLFLRENLKLRLVNARLALLARDGRSFRQDVRQSSEWLERYFDFRAKSVQASVATLKTLASVDVGGEVPALTETLDALRGFKVGKEKR